MTNITENSKKVPIKYLWGSRSGWSYEKETGYFILDSTNGKHIPYFSFRGELGRKIVVLQTSGISYIFRIDTDGTIELTGELYGGELRKLGLNYLDELKATTRKNILQALEKEHEKDLEQNLQEVIDSHCSCCGGNYLLDKIEEI